MANKKATGARAVTLKVVAEKLIQNDDMEFLYNFFRLYPLLANKLIRLVTLAGDELVDFLDYFPDKFTANKLNYAIRRKTGDSSKDDEDDDSKFENDAEEMEGDSDLDDDEDEESPSEPEKQSSKPSKPDSKEKSQGTSENVSYDEMSSLELYKLCKKRNIPAEQRKTSKYYIKLLKEADEIASNLVPDDETDEWNEIEDKTPDPESKPAKKPGRPKKAEPKQEEPSEVEDDADDEWDIL